MPVAPLDRDRPQRRRPPRRPSATQRARAQERTYVSQGRAVEKAARQQRATPRPSTPQLGRSHPTPRTTPVQRAKAQQRQYGSQGVAVRRAAKQQRQAAERRRRRSRQRYFSRKPAEALQRKIRRGESALSMLQGSDPEGYARRRQEHGDFKPAGVNVEKGLREANKGFQKGIAFGQKFLATNKQENYPGLAKRPTVGGAAGDGMREVLDLVSNAPTSAYLTGAAANAARKGNAKPAKKLWKDFKDTSALSAAVSGNFKEAAKRAGERPVTTALELSGAKAVIGRGAGFGMRHAPGPKGFRTKVRKAASTERPNLKLSADPKASKQLQTERKYSRDVINKAAQVYVERRTRKGSRVRKDGTQRRPGRDPHVDTGTYLVPAGRGHAGLAGAPIPRLQNRRLDTRVFSSQRVMERRRRDTERAAKKEVREGKETFHTDRARADMIRTELRQRVKTATPKEKKHLRTYIALPDDQLIKAVEGSARERMGTRGERVVGGLSKEQGEMVSRVLARRKRRGQYLTPAQHKAVDQAVTRQIEREVKTRREGQPLAPHGLAAAVANVSLRKIPGGAERRAVERLSQRRAPKGPNPATLQAAATRAGVKLPVVVRPLSPRMRTLNDGTQRRGGYGGIKSDRATGKRYHAVYFNPDHGVGARNAAIWHELQHAREVEAGRAHAPTNKLTKAEYDALKTEQSANKFMDQNMDLDLFAGPEQFRRPHIDPLRPRDFNPYFETLIRREATPAERILPKQGDVQLAGLRPDPADVPHMAGARAMYETGLENQRLMADEFGIPIGKKGSRKSRDSAQAWINRQGREAELVPFKRADGEWVAAPRTVTDRLAAHHAVDEGLFRPGGGIDRGTSVFKDVVLTSASPSRWLGGNVTDIGMRTLFEGITPMDVMRGLGVDRRLKKEGLQGEQASQALHQGGLYTTGGEGILGQDLLATGTRGSKYNVPRQAWRLWKRGIYSMEHAIETIPLYGTTGKAMRRETVRQRDSLRGLLKITDEMMTDYARGIAKDRAKEARLQKGVEDVMGRWGKVSPAMRRTLSLAPFAQWLGAATRYVYVTLPVHHPIKTSIGAAMSEMTEEERIRLGLSYFAPADQRAPDYQMGLLPTDVGANKYGPVVEGTRTSRMTSLGTAGSNPWNLPEFLLPQIASGMNALRGQSFTGEPLEYPSHFGPDKEGLPMDMPDRLPVAAGAQLESMVPFASAFRRAILEQGRPAEPYSTILTPATRPQFNYDEKRYEEREGSMGAGLREWISPWAPKSRIYTLGAGRDIERSQNTLRQLEQWQKRQKREREREQSYGPAPARSKGGDDFWGSGSSKPKVKTKDSFWD